MVEGKPKPTGCFFICNGPHKALRGRSFHPGTVFAGFNNTGTAGLHHASFHVFTYLFPPPLGRVQISRSSVLCTVNVFTAFGINAHGLTRGGLGGPMSRQMFALKDAEAQTSEPWPEGPASQYSIPSASL